MMLSVPEAPNPPASLAKRYAIKDPPDAFDAAKLPRVKFVAVGFVEFQAVVATVVVPLRLT